MPDTSTALALLDHFRRRRDRQVEQAATPIHLGVAERNSVLAFAAVDATVRELAELDQAEQTVRRLWVREPLTYEPGAPHSFFADLARCAMPGADLDLRAREARARLDQHAREMVVELEVRRSTDRRRFDAAKDVRGGGYERRVNPNRTDGTGGYLVPPLWLVDRTAAAPLAGRPLAGLVGTTPLPTGTDSISIPKLVTNPSTAPQTADAGSISSTDFTDSSASSTVETIAGQALVSQQLVDQVPAPGLDAIVWRVMAEAYDAQLEAQVLAGSGASGQLLGLTNVSGVVSVAYTSGSPTVNGVQVATLQAASQLFDVRFRPAEAMFMAGRRWYWMNGQALTDSASALVPSNPAGRGYLPPEPNLAGDGGPVGPLAGVPVYLDGAVTTTAGAGTNQDQVILTRPSDHALFESEPHLTAAVEPLAGTLQVRLTLYRYAAFIGGLYPSATAVVSGTGLTAPANY